jgi:hypothetical protein
MTTLFLMLKKKKIMSAPTKNDKKLRKLFQNSKRRIE